MKVSTSLVYDLASFDPDVLDIASLLPDAPPRPEDGPCVPTSPVPLRLHIPEEECGMGPACWLWDYLRRSGTKMSEAPGTLTGR